jgi:hypothetical protein
MDKVRLYQMVLGEIYQECMDSPSMTRVPGGWVYESRNRNLCFIPFSREFDTRKEPEQYNPIKLDKL